MRDLFSFSCLLHTNIYILLRILLMFQSFVNVYSPRLQSVKSASNIALQHYAFPFFYYVVNHTHHIHNCSLCVVDTNETKSLQVQHSAFSIQVMSEADKVTSSFMRAS